MNAFIQRTPQERLEAFLEVSRVTRLDSISVEKDFWVCWTLRELFTLPGIGGHLTFLNPIMPFRLVPRWRRPWNPWA